MKNKLVLEYERVRTALKERGVKLSKDDFFNQIGEGIEQSFFNTLIEKNSPKDFLVREKFKTDPSFQKEVMKIYEASL